jgi:hypothetical protein
MAPHSLGQRIGLATAARRTRSTAIAFAAALLVTRSAAAQTSNGVVAVLRYLRDPSASRCPDENALRAAVASRLGYDPFHADAPLTIMVSITRAGRGLRARVWRESADAPPSTPRTLSSPHLDCTELAGVVALTVAIAVDPLTAAGASPSASPSSSPPPSDDNSTAPASTAPSDVLPRAAPAASVAPAVVASPAPPADDAIHPTIRLGLFGTVGFQPTPTLGFVGAGGLRWRAFSLDLEAAATIPFAITDANDVRARAGLITGSLVPCIHVSWFAACGVVTVGALRGAIEHAQPVVVATPFAAIGARAAIDLRIAGPFWLYAHADLLAALTPTELRLDETTVWSSFPVSGTLGAGVAAHFR